MYYHAGIAFKYGATTTSCCDCFYYQCYYGSDSIEGYFMYWRLYRINSKCCQDCKGVIYPPEEASLTSLIRFIQTV